MPYCLIAVLVTACLSAPVPQDSQPAPAPVEEAASAGLEPLEVTYLANEGFLLRVGEDAVLIDGFVGKPYARYSALPEEAAAVLKAAKPPFDDVAIALTSHFHPDHFQPALACDFLAASPQTLFVSSPEVLETLALVCEEREGREVLPEEGESESLEHEGIQVEFLRLAHGTRLGKRVQNLGHLITLGGHQILHLGDADMEHEMFAPYALLQREVDLVFVPYWYFDAPKGLYVIEKNFPDATLVACHVPESELETVASSLAEEFPAVVLFQESMQVQAFSAGKAEEPTDD